MERFISGNIACAEAALLAGCRFFAGYPITPSSEIAEKMAEELPKVGGIFIQMEDEIASIAACLGASAAGLKAMTATSGPGFSLMQENIGLGIMMELPSVIVNVQRAGPSTGIPTLVGQGDMMQARWGSHGAYEIIALTPSTPQEMFGLTVRAFNLSEEYRLPVLLMSDEVIGHMCEKVIIPNSVKLKNRALPTIHSSKYLPFETSDNLIPTIPNAGMGYKIHLTGLTHDERGYPIMDGETQEKLVRRLNDKIRKHKAKIIEFEELLIEDAEIVIISYGISARVAISALRRARKNNIKVGMLKLLTVWPFPEEFLEELSEQVKAFIVPELNYGQIYYEVKRCSKGKEVILVPKMGGATHEPEDIYKTIRKVS